MPTCLRLRLAVRPHRDDLSVPCLGHVLTVVGGLTEIGGLALVVVEIVKVQRREIPEHRGWVVRSLAAMREAGSVLAVEVARMLRRQPRRRDVTIDAGPASISVSAGGAVVTTGKAGPAPTLRQRIERLEREIRRLDGQSANDRQEMRDEAKRAREHAEGIDHEIRAMIEERDRQRRQGFRDALALQWIGTGAFMLGVGLSVAGNLVPC